MKPNTVSTNIGRPLRLDELDIQGLARYLYDNNIRWKNGKRVGEIVHDDDSTEFVGLHDGQRKIVEAKARFKVVACGRRFGKSALASLVALAAFMQPNRRIWIVGPEYGHVEKIFQELHYVLVTQLGLIGKDVKNSKARSSKGDYFLESPWGSIIEGKSGTNPDSMAGEALDLIVFDEAGLEPALNTIWRQMLRPTLTDKKGSAIFISTPRGKNEFYKLYKMGEIGLRQAKGLENFSQSNDFREWASWSMPTYSNPFIPASEYEDSKKEALLTGNYLMFKQEYDADFDSVSDAAFPEFKATVKSPDDPNINLPYHVQNYQYHPSYGPWFAACDFNIARPASTIYAQVDKEGNVMVFGEMFKACTAFIQAQYIVEKQRELGFAYSAVIGDVSGSFRKSGVNEFDEMRVVLGHHPEGIRQGRETGNHLLHEWLAYPIFDERGNLVKDDMGEPKTRPKLFISSTCVETIHALETAKRKLGKDGSIKDDYKEFTSGHEGLLDCLRYLFVFLFYDRPQTEVKKGVY